MVAAKISFKIVNNCHQKVMNSFKLYLDTFDEPEEVEIGRSEWFSGHLFWIPWLPCPGLLLCIY